MTQNNIGDSVSQIGLTHEKQRLSGDLERSRRYTVKQSFMHGRSLMYENRSYHEFKATPDRLGG